MFFFGMIIIVIGILLVVMPVEIRFLYQGGLGGHSLLLRFEFLLGKIGFGTKVYFGRSKGKEKSRLRVVEKIKLKTFFHSGGEDQYHLTSSLDELLIVFSRYQKLLRYGREFAERSFCQRFIWETELGFADHALTGMATGLVWAGKGAALGYLSRLIKMDCQNVRIQVTPYFGKQHWESTIDCIFKTRLGHIITALSRFLIWWIKMVWDKKKRGDRIWGIIPSKPL